MKTAILEAANSKLPAIEGIYLVSYLHLDFSKTLNASSRKNWSCFGLRRSLEGRDRFNQDIFFAGAFRARSSGLSDRIMMTTVRGLYS